VLAIVSLCTESPRALTLQMLLQPAPAVTALQSIVVALATPLLLLSADLSGILKHTGLMLRAFVCGAIGTALGALLGVWLVRTAHLVRAREADILRALNLQRVFKIPQPSVSPTRSRARKGCRVFRRR
jgi:hypothetical protein